MDTKNKNPGMDAKNKNPPLQGGHGQTGRLLQTGGFGLKAIAGIQQGIFSSDKFCKFVRHSGHSMIRTYPKLKTPWVDLR